MPPESSRAKPADVAQGRRAASQAMIIAREHRWVQLRLLGWLLIGAWQVLSLVSEFYPLVDLESRTLRVTGKILGLVGLVLIAMGFERMVHLAHERAQLH